jgi:hypothetical protein
MEGSPEPVERLEQLADLFARLEELGLIQEILRDRTLTGQVDAVCSMLKARTRLCKVCLSVSEQIAMVARRMGEIGGAFGLDALWPPRERDTTYPLETFTDGVRLLPPEKVDEGVELPFNVIRHHTNGTSLLESAKYCPFCELLRMAIILDSFRQHEVPYDKPTTDLFQMILAIRLGKGLKSLNAEFEQILEGIRSSRDAIYLVIGESGNAFEHLRVVWQKPVSIVGRDGDRKVVYTKLKVFASSR